MLPVFEYRKNTCGISNTPCDDRDKIFLPFLSSNLIDPNHISSPYGLPIDFCTHIAVENAHDRLITHILLYAHILYCAIDES